jgi:SDR family mycofactocin-dependent oxidoreductase
VGKLDGQVAFITGAARGQGRSHALALAAEGADIIGVDLCRQAPTAPYPMSTPEDLAETVRQVEALDRRMLASQVDVRDLAALTRAVDDGVAELGRLDIVLANAGIVSFSPTVEMAEDVWDEMIDISLTGVWKTIRASVPHIIAGGRGGSVVITSSLGSMNPSFNIAHYCAAKAGVVMLAKVLAKELGPQRIRVNTVNPTTVGTDMAHNESMFRLFRPDLPDPTQADFEEVARTMNAIPVPTVDAADVSNAVLYLVTDSGRFVTGTSMVIDAGRLL